MLKPIMSHKKFLRKIGAVKKFVTDPFFLEMIGTIADALAESGLTRVNVRANADVSYF